MLMWAISNVHAGRRAPSLS